MGRQEKWRKQGDAERGQRREGRRHEEERKGDRGQPIGRKEAERTGGNRQEES